MQVSILGCGWLGYALACLLQKNGYTIKGSTTTPEKIAALRKVGIESYVINLNHPVAGELQPFLQGSQVLIINIPPRIKDATLSYPDKMRALLPHIQDAGITRVVFVSSTSVYTDGAFPYPVITEETPASPQAENGRQILEAERVLQNSSAFKTTIVRLSGLVGPNRHPVHYLAGRKGIDNPNAPINLIDQATAIHTILRVIEANAWGEVFLASDENHTSREAFYKEKAKELALMTPQFNHDKPSVGKIISSAKAKRILGISFNGRL